MDTDTCHDTSNWRTVNNSTTWLRYTWGHIEETVNDICLIFMGHVILKIRYRMGEYVGGV